MAKKKPTLTKFTEILKAQGGNLSKAAAVFGVSRQTLYSWANEDERYKEAIDNTRMQLFDDCVSMSRVVALGIPKIEDKKIVGWVERPDPSMLRYLMSTLGRKEGFGDALDVTTGGMPIDTGFQIEVIDRREQIQKKEEE